MLGINTALGFSPWAETTEWQLKLKSSQGWVVKADSDNPALNTFISTPPGLLR